MIWRLTKLFYLTLIISMVYLLKAENRQQTIEHNEPTIWLLKPESHIAERQANSNRLPEAMCPTKRVNNDVRTQLQSGAVVEVQWRQRSASANKRIGGDVAKIELLAADSNSILARLDQVGEETTASEESISKSVRIPKNFDCRECILRLTVDVDAQSQAVSCADVQITARNQSTSDVECFADADCVGGECFRNACYCPAGKYGPNCGKGSNYKSELAAEVKTSKYNAFTFPTQGQFLWRIDQEQNAVELAMRVPRRTKSGSDTIEWYALGVRPEDDASKTKCMRMMSAAGSERARGMPTKSEIDQRSENSVQVKTPTIGIRPVAPVRSGGSASCGENEQWTTCPEFTRECEPSCDWTAFPESIPSCPKACGEPRCACREGYVRAANNNNECRPFEFCQAAEVTIEECPQNETFTKCGTSCEPNCETMYNVDPCKDSCLAPACACIGDHVRFNDKCIFWANCPHLEEHFISATAPGIPPSMVVASQAASTKPKAPTAPKRPLSATEEVISGSTPKTDSPFITDGETQQPFSDRPAIGSIALHCAANETVNECGRVCEVDCVTIFERDDCSECDLKPACACKQGYARDGIGNCVYWNDCPTHKSEVGYVSSVGTTTTASIAAKTLTAERERHMEAKEETDMSNANIGTTTAAKSSTTDSLESAPVVLHDCFGEWEWPVGCTKSCDYKISWVYAPEGDLIDFALEAKVPVNWWSGVGFTAGKESSAIEWIVVKSQNGEELTLHDMHSEEDGKLIENPKPAVFASDARLGTYSNGLLKATFSRPRGAAVNTTSSFASFADGQCYKFLFPVSGGRLQPEDGAISAPLSPPHITPMEICISACAQKSTKQPTASAAPTTSSSSVGYTCQTEFRYPDGCVGDACDYRASWALDAANADVAFEISARGIGRWTGVGMSADGQMANADVYTGWVYDQRAYVTDRFSPDRSTPPVDASNDVYNVSGILRDDIQTISFRRKVVTTDNRTDFPLDHCWHFLFPVGGGRVMARQGDDFRHADTPIGYHDQALPEFSALRVCLCVDGVPLDIDVPAGADVKRNDGTPVQSARAAAAVGGHQRVRRQMTASATAADDAFMCSDVALVKVRDGTKIHVEDAFALSKRSVSADAFSFNDVSTQIDGDTLTVLLRKPLNETEANDFSLANGPVTIYLASGRGPVDFSAADLPIELTRVNLIYPEKNLMTSSTKGADGTTEPITSLSSSSTDEFTSPNSDGPFDMSSSAANAQTTVGQESTTEEPTTPVGVNSGWSTSRMTDRSNSTASEAEMIGGPFSTELQTFDSTSTSQKTNPSTADETPYADDNCYGAFRYPDGCESAGACEYFIQWAVNSVKKSVDFRLSAVTAAERWTGVAFSSDGAMANADVIIVSVLADSTVAVTDQFSAGYGRPRVDKMQDVFNAESTFRDGRVQANFSRSLQTGDVEDDVDLLSRCYRFIFLHTGGVLEGGSGEIRKHSQTPITSRKKICLGKCGLIEAMTTPAIAIETTSTPTTEAMKIPMTPKRVDVPEKKGKGSEADVEVLRAGVADDAVTVAIPPSKPSAIDRLYDVVVRLKSEKWSADLEEATSERFAKIVARIVNALKPALATRWPSLKDVRVLKFAEGSVMSLLQVEFSAGGEAPSEPELRNFLHSLIANGEASSSAVAALGIDPNAMEVRENTQNLEDKWGPLNEMGAWLIVGAVLAVCAIICGLCIACICRRRRRSSTIKHNKSMDSFSPYYAYQYAASAYSTGITNAAYLGGLSSGKDSVDPSKMAGGSGGSSTASTTTTTRANGKKSVDKSPRTSKTRYEVSEPNTSILNGGGTRCPRGMGETTYQEWFAKVASKDTPSHYQESAYATPPICRQLGAGYSPAIQHHPQTQPQQSYVTYPNDPGSYYTLNGDHKLPPPYHHHRY